jgi:hypothetical protein
MNGGGGGAAADSASGTKFTSRHLSTQRRNMLGDGLAGSDGALVIHDVYGGASPRARGLPAGAQLARTLGVARDFDTTDGYGGAVGVAEDGFASAYTADAMPPSRPGHMRVGVEWLGRRGLMWLVVPTSATAGEVIAQARALVAERAPSDSYGDGDGDGDGRLWLRVGNALRHNSELLSECGVRDHDIVSVLSSGPRDLADAPPPPRAAQHTRFARQSWGGDG